MTRDQSTTDSAETPFEAPFSTTQDDPQSPEITSPEIAQPYIGQWNQLISTTNWEKGRIIGQWRAALIESGADSSQHSDDAWSRGVGGVTAPHVGRLRRVFDRYGSTYQTYKDLSWTHFLAALDWDDAPLWLEGASREGWSVSGMREQRWQAHGAVASQRPTSSQIIEVDTDEDVVVPAQGDRTKAYGDEPGAAAGKTYDNADFGEEEELTSLAGSGNSPDSIDVNDAGTATSVQPFAGLPELPDDLSDAIETLKLAVLRHKTSQWEKTDMATVQRYLDAVTVLMSA